MLEGGGVVIGGGSAAGAFFLTASVILSKNFSLPNTLRLLNCSATCMYGPVSILFIIAYPSALPCRGAAEVARAPAASFLVTASFFSDLKTSSTAFWRVVSWRSTWGMEIFTILCP